MIKKLELMPYAQAHIEIDENDAKTLVSYRTVVAYIDSDGWLEVYGLYSATTRRHIGAFVKEFSCLDYQTAKQIYNDNMRINIHTGEVEPLFDDDDDE